MILNVHLLLFIRCRESPANSTCAQVRSQMQSTRTHEHVRWLGSNHGTLKPAVKIVSSFQRAVWVSPQPDSLEDSVHFVVETLFCLKKICPVTFWSSQVLTLPGVKKKKKKKKRKKEKKRFLKKEEGGKSHLWTCLLGSFPPSCLPSIIFTVKNFFKKCEM